MYESIYTPQILFTTASQNTPSKAMFRRIFPDGTSRRIPGLNHYPVNKTLKGREVKEKKGMDFA